MNAPTITPLQEVLDLVTVDREALRCTVRGEVLEADDTRSLESELGRRLYERLHVGWPPGRTFLARVDRDPAAEKRIGAAVGTRTVDIPVHDVRRDGDVTTAVMFGARVRLDRSLAADTTPGAESTTIAMPDSWPAISPGFHMVFGPHRPRSTASGALWRVYLSAETFDDGLDTFTSAVAHLREHARTWQAKMASTASVYPRTDAVTVYLDETELHHVEALAHRIGARSDRVSSFVAVLAPGVGLAQEPADPDPARRGLSYGQHRASVLARVALTDPTGLDGALTAAGVHPTEYWRNAPLP